jgi:hypothetical protein
MTEITSIAGRLKRPYGQLAQAGSASTNQRESHHGIIRAHRIRFGLPQSVLPPTAREEGGEPAHRKVFHPGV